MGWSLLCIIAAMVHALVAMMVALPARAADEKRPTLTVLAAASLADVMPKLAAAWPGAAKAKPTFDFDASSRLAKQVESGLKADVVVTADQEWMDYLAKKSLIREKTRRVVARNSLVAVAPAASKAEAAAPKDLRGAAWKRLALAGETVPAGRYAKAALERLGLWEELSARVVRGQDVRSTLHWAAVGEADAAIVYATDAGVEPRVRVLFTFPEDSHEPIVYPAAVLEASASADAARSFVEFCGSAAAAPIWRAAGFLPGPVR